MIPPRTPENEQSRLAALRALGVLDGPVEERFDRITRLLAKLLDVPIAIISLVDSEREWLKSCHGISQCESRRETSFCGHAILGEDVFLIPDARKDPRFADNPQVTGPMKIRFYAGCPLRAADGSRIGALCIKDRRPRQLTESQVQLLKDLAAWVECELLAQKPHNGSAHQKEAPPIKHDDADAIKTLQEANEKLRAANQLKDDFVAKVSHELRTPLTSIKEGLSLMLEKALGSISPEQCDFLKTMDQEIDRLTELINNMLDIAKIESGRMHLARTELDVRELVANLVRAYQPLAGQRRLQVSMDKVPPVFGDANRMRQVMTNLLSNAIKFTGDNGTISFRIGHQGDKVIVIVEDDGVGMASEDLPKLFRKFSQVGVLGALQSKGSGLGLAVCKELVELHKGTIAVSSRLGEGAAFTITLPVYSADVACQEFIEELAQGDNGQTRPVGLVAIRAPEKAQEPGDAHMDSAYLRSFADIVRSHVQRSDIVMAKEPYWIAVLAASSPDGVRALSRRLKRVLPNGERLIMGAAMHFGGVVDAKRLFGDAASAQGAQFLES